MAVEIQLDPSTQPQQIPEAPKPIMEIELNARRTMDGDVMIFDHADIDIIIMKKKEKDFVIAERHDVRSCIRRPRPIFILF